MVLTRLSASYPSLIVVPSGYALYSTRPLASYVYEIARDGDAPSESLAGSTQSVSVCSFDRTVQVRFTRASYWLAPRWLMANVTLPSPSYENVSL
jgi:hypothetical protein